MKIKTIVSSNMTDRICEKNNVALFEVLTGFKNIAAKIKEFDKYNTYKCIMGFEESYGCLVGDEVRDKDGIAALMILSEAAAFYKNKGLTLWDNMKEMYKKYGYYKESLIAIVLEGADGAQKIKNMMEDLRANPPAFISDSKVLKIRDYLTGTIKNIEENKTEEKELPKSNVLYFELENDYWVAARPSGTEPKIKFYTGVRGNNLEDAENKLNKLTEGVKKLIR